MSLTTILLIAIPIGIMVVMHSVGHGGHLRSRSPHGPEHEPLGEAGAADPRTVGPDEPVESRHRGHQHGSHGGCC